MVEQGPNNRDRPDFPPPPHRVARAARDGIRPIHLLLCLPWLVLLGWMTPGAWSLCKDAFISFRYARNLLEGHGLVFNPGEYIEGYSNFLWVLELAALWGVFGWRPEHTAMWLSVACTGGTLAAMLWWVARLPGLPQRRLVAWMAVGLVCSSATFAVWTTARGLETRQFTMCIVLAVVGLTLYPERRRALLGVSLSLAAAALTRPEGPLFAACCFGWEEALRRGLYAVQVGPALWMPFDAPSREWVAARFVRFEETLENARLLMRGPFSVYLGPEGNLLLYVKDGCDPSEPTVFLHVVPVKLADLVVDRQQYGFENRDFTIPPLYSPMGRPRLTQLCVMRRGLPDYPIAAIRTGQYMAESGERLWEREFRFGEAATQRIQK